MTLQQVEGEAFAVDAKTRARLIAAMSRLKNELRFRSWPLADSPRGRIVVRGIVGSISLGDGKTLEIVPKTLPGDDWIRSVLSLLVGTDRIDAFAERLAGLSAERKSILQVLAAIYAGRLERALRRDGPILLLRRQRRVATVLKGKLDTTAWLRHALHSPHIFPADANALTADNDFSQALAAVAGELASVARSPTIRARLGAAKRALLPGLPEHPRVAAGVELRRLPPQWAAYRPAWSIAGALLAHRSLLGPRGVYEGVNIAIEPWPLLERLLLRALRAAAKFYVPSAGDPVVTVPLSPSNRALLLSPISPLHKSRDVQPDGCLQIDGKIRVVFDAKYKRRDDSDWPDRADIYQVFSTAAAFGASLAVLVYPEKFDPIFWKVEGPGVYPSKLAAIGIGLFSYREGGSRERGRSIVDLLAASGSVPPPSSFAGTTAV